MPLKVVRIRFGEVKIDGKFMTNVPGRTKKVRLIKKWKNAAVLEDKSSTLMYAFKDTDMVCVWRFRHG